MTRQILKRINNLNSTSGKLYRCCSYTRDGNNHKRLISYSGCNAGFSMSGSHTKNAYLVANSYSGIKSLENSSTI